MQQIHCLECWYTLNGLDKSRCPECGREFELNDHRTYGLEQESNGSKREVLIPLLAALVVSGFIVFYPFVHWLWIEYVLGRQGI